MIPMPNFFAGVMIGIANESWGLMFLAALAWGAVFCMYVNLMHSDRRRQTIEKFQERGQRLILDSPTFTFYIIEYTTGFITSLLFGSITFLLKGLF